MLAVYVTSALQYAQILCSYYHIEYAVKTMITIYNEMIQRMRMK